VAVDHFGGPEEAHVLHFHPARLPDFNEILADQLDVSQVPAHFVVHQCEYVGDPKHEDAACLSDLVDDVAFNQALCDVHAA